MKTIFKNQTTGEEIAVFDLFINAEGKVESDGKRGARFLAKYASIIAETAKADDGSSIFECVGDWSVLSGSKKRATTTPKATDATTDATTGDATGDATPTKPTRRHKKVTKVADAPTPTEEPTPAAMPAETPTDDTDAARALITAIKSLRGGALDVAQVEAIIDAKLAALAKTPEKLKLAIKAATKKAGEVFCNKFERIVSKVARGNNVYLYGPAGSGKSHTAEQVARELGLDFYGQTTIQFAHDVRGYGDAGGNFQETPFFKAFAHGGLYFQDEYDRSNAEAAIVLNSALANGWYDFPVVGRVVAHPNFRFMAAGNTTMSGASEEYITGQEIDASSRDRFGFYFEVGYNHEVEMHIAHGDAETVAFAEDVRNAIKVTGVRHVVSYRATAAMTDERENENDREACIVEAVFKGLEVDERSIIYGSLKDKNNEWAKALKRTLQ